MFLQWVLVVVIWVFSIHLSFSQQPAYFFLGEKEFEGIQIYDVIQDNELNYWFATDQGFYKYDNYTFQSIDCAEMKGLAAFGFVKSKQGTIFCYNLNSQIIKIEEGKCSVFYELKVKERSSDIYLFMTNEDDLLVLTNIAIVLDEKGNKKDLNTPVPNYYGFPFELSNGNIISHVANKDSLLIYDGRKFETVPLIKDNHEINGVLKFFESDNAIYAISTGDKRVYIFKPKSFSLISCIKYDELNEKEFLRFYNEGSSLWMAGTVSGVRVLYGCQFDLPKLYYDEYLISDVFNDSEGNTLLSTFNHGVLVLPYNGLKDVLEIPGSPDIVSSYIDENLGLVLGTLKGSLLSYLNGKTNVLSSSGSKPIQNIFTWKDFPYIIFDDGQIKLLHKETKKIVVVAPFSLKDAVIANDGTVYLALNRGVAKLSFGKEVKFELIEKLKVRTYAIGTEKSNGLIYVATADGLFTLNSQGEVKKVELDGKSIFVNDIYNYRDSVFLASKKEGVLVYKNGKFIRQIFPKLNGELMELNKLVVELEKIYGLTNLGFITFFESNHTAIQLNKVNGFSTNKIFDFEIIGDTLWINHSKGIQKLHMDYLYPTEDKPLIFMRRVTVNAKDVTEGANNIHFDYNQRNFKFVFSSPTLKNKENIRYHFKLEGYNDTWQTSNYLENEVSFNALAPGEYTFLVRAENQGVFSETLSYSFTISAPVYLRWWFITGLSLVVLIIISLIYRNKLITQRKKAKQLNELNASKLTAIQSQMNPHFIFNSLNSIQDLVLKGDIDNSYTFITKFSDLVRRTLSYSEKDFIDFEQEMKLIELYLTLEKLRFKEDLEYTIDSESIEDIMIPPMLIQPFIENALLHGLLHKDGLKKLKITFRLEELLICEITDNGVGRKKSTEIKERQRADHESFASNAIKKRFEILSEHYQNKLGFEYQDLEENGIPIGTKVTLFIPVKHKF